MSYASLPTSLRFVLAARRCELQSIEKLAYVGELIGVTNGLIHALQIERGFGNLYLANRSNKHLATLDDLSAQAQAAEGALRRYFDGFDLEQATAAERARLFNGIAVALQELDELPALRQAIRKQRLPAPQAFSQFSRLISSLLSVVFEATDGAYDPTLSPALVALFNFMQGKERAGQERATGVSGFVSGLSTGEQLALLEYLHEEQQTCFALFSEHVSAPLLASWRSFLNSEAQAEYVQMRSLIMEPSSRVRVDAGLADIWFDVATARIDAMRKIEEALAKDFQQLCRSSIQIAKNEVNEYGVQLKRMAKNQGAGNSPKRFYVQSGAGEHRHSGQHEHFPESIVDLVQKQSLQLEHRASELKRVRQCLDERRAVRRAKNVIMREHQLNDMDATLHLHRTAVGSGQRMAEAAKVLLNPTASSRKWR